MFELISPNRWRFVLLISLAMIIAVFVLNSESSASNGRTALRTRSELARLARQAGMRTMIEIGVYQGEFAELMLTKWARFDHYYGIDLWQQQKNYLDSSNADDAKRNQDYQITLSRLTKKFGQQRITLIRNFSTVAVDRFAHQSIDFIYVDARHDYCGALEDMQAYYPKLRCGGLFAGHDYQYDSGTLDDDWGVCANGSRIEGSVKKAVLEFAQLNSVPKVYNTGESRHCSWYFFKNC